MEKIKRMTPKEGAEKVMADFREDLLRLTSPTHVAEIIAKHVDAKNGFISLKAIDMHTHMSGLWVDKTKIELPEELAPVSEEERKMLKVVAREVADRLRNK